MSLRSIPERLLALPVARYIRRQRDDLSPTARPLSESVKHRLSGCFTAVDLDRVRIAQLDRLPLPGDALIDAAAKIGWSIPKPSAVAAITFDHVIATQVPMDDVLLFHELVHVVQYRLLGGIEEFSRLYVRGFLARGSYDGIPLEQCAYALEARFAAGDQRFAVEKEASQWLDNRSGHQGVT